MVSAAKPLLEPFNFKDRKLTKFTKKSECTDPPIELALVYENSFRINYKRTPHILSRSKRNPVAEIQEGTHPLGFMSGLTIKIRPDEKSGSPDINLRLWNIQKYILRVRINFCTQLSFGHEQDCGGRKPSDTDLHT